MTQLYVDFFCVAFLEYMLAGKTLLDYTNLISSNDYEKNENIVYEYSENKYGKLKRRP